MKDADLARVLGGLPAEIKRRVLALRSRVRRTVPGAAETCLWDGLSYHRPEVGGRVKGAVCQISFKKGEVRLEFIHGIRLADPAGLLRGQRTSKRFIVIESDADVKQPRIRDLILQAASLDPTQWTDDVGLSDRGRARKSDSRRRA